jgi:aryl-alcohol dehydrogenase-like predicted oxidoreductase
MDCTRLGAHGAQGQSALSRHDDFGPETAEVDAHRIKVVYVGSSNFAGWHIAQACEAAKARHFLGLVSEQSLYDLIDRTVELEVIPACQSYGLGLIPWRPLKGGALGGALAKAQQGRRGGDNAQRAFAKHRAKLEAYAALAKRLALHRRALRWRGCSSAPR